MRINDMATSCVKKRSVLGRTRHVVERDQGASTVGDDESGRRGGEQRQAGGKIGVVLLESAYVAVPAV